MVGVSFARLYTFIYDYGIDKERMWSYGKFKKQKRRISWQNEGNGW